MGSWLSEDTCKPEARAPTTSKAMPPKTIPTFSTDAIARKGFFFAGGKYWGEPGREIMRGAMYTEVLVPKQIRQPNPIVHLPRQRADRRGLAADAGRTRGLGVSPRPAGLRGLHGGLPGTGALRLRPGGRPRRQDADRRQSEHSHGPRARTHLDERARAGRFPAEDEPHAVAGHGQDGRPDLRRLCQEPGPIGRRQPAARRRGGRRACST